MRTKEREQKYNRIIVNKFFKLKALVNNPKYLKDLEKVSNNSKYPLNDKEIKEIKEFKKKYNLSSLSIIPTRKFVEDLESKLKQPYYETTDELTIKSNKTLYMDNGIPCKTMTRPKGTLLRLKPDDAKRLIKKGIIKPEKKYRHIKKLQRMVFFNDDLIVKITPFIPSENIKLEDTVTMGFDLFFENDRYLTLNIKIDMQKVNKQDLIEKILEEYDIFKKNYKKKKIRVSKTRKVDEFYVWIERRIKGRKFVEIAKELKVDPSTVRKAHNRVYKRITGEEYNAKSKIDSYVDKDKYSETHKEELPVRCDTCENQICITTGRPCKDIEGHINQDYGSQKEWLNLNQTDPEQDLSLIENYEDPSSLLDPSI